MDNPSGEPKKKAGKPKKKTPKPPKDPGSPEAPNKPRERVDINAITEGLEDPHHARETMLFLRRALLNGWISDPFVKRLIPVVPKKLGKIILNKKSSARLVIMASKTFGGLVKNDTDVAIALDRMERLEDGDPTDIVHTPEIEARAQEILDRYRKVNGKK